MKPFLELSSELVSLSRDLPGHAVRILSERLSSRLLLATAVERLRSVQREGIELTPEVVESLIQLEAADELSSLDRSVPEEDLRELGEGVEAELSLLRGPEMQALVREWREGSDAATLPDDLLGVVADWRAHLDVECVAAYCSAAAALVRSTLLDADLDDGAAGTIGDLRGEPVLEVFAAPGSVLAEERGTPDGGLVRVETAEFIEHLAARCDEASPWAELAWRHLAPSLAEPERSDVLPRLRTRAILGGSEVRVELGEE